MLNFEGKVAIVTGAGGGLGKAYASLLAERGAKVLVNDLGGGFTGVGSDQSYGEKAAQEIRDQGGIAEANGDTVATPEGAKAIVADALNRWGQVDILINNAGIASGAASIDQLTDKQWEDDMAVSASGTFYLCRELWTHMLERNYGRIINVSSGSFFGMGSGVPYPAAKGAIWAMTKALGNAARAQGKNVLVNCIMPCAQSRMTSQMGPEINELMGNDFPAKSVAPVVAMLAHDEAPCNGELFTVGGGGYARVFSGVCKGYRGTDKDWTIEDAVAHFDEAMSPEEYFIPKDAMEEVEAYESSVPWDVFRQYIT